MRNQPESHSFALAVALAALLVATAMPVSAAHDDAVRELRLAVYDAQGREIAVISPDEPLRLARGQQVRLRMFEPRDGGRRVVPTEFVAAAGESVAAINGTRYRREQGEIDVEIRQNARVTGPLVLEYRVLQNVPVAWEGLRRGHLTLHATDVSPGWGNQPGYVPPQSSAERVVTGLYRGILLRDPDPEGSAQAQTEIVRRGWAGLVDVARNMAGGRESTYDLYQRGVTAEQRLAALYRTLLDTDPRYVDSNTWRWQLDRIARGDIAGVVDEMIQSEAFRRHYDVDRAFRR